MSAKRTTTLIVMLVFVTLSNGTMDAAEVKITPDVVYGHKLGLAMTLDVYRPTENANGAGVLFMVSGGWYSRWAPPEGRQRFFAPLTDKGFTVFAVRHGSSPRFGIPEAVADVRRSVRYIRRSADRFQVDPQRLGVYGMSAGGHLSLVLGTASDKGKPGAADPVAQTSDRVQAVVAYVAPTDLRIMVWEAPEMLPAYKRYPALNLNLKQAAEYSPLAHVTPDDPPTLLLVGAKDELVPPKHSDDIYKAFKSKKVPTKIVSYPESAHGFKQPDAKRATAEMVAWFEKYLAKK